MGSKGVDPLLDAINGAKSTIDVSVYLMTDKKVIEALKNAAKSGRTVRVMLESKVLGSSSSDDLWAQDPDAAAEPAGEDQDFDPALTTEARYGDPYKDLAKDLTEAGCQVKATPEKFDAAQTYDHAKFMIIDGKQSFVGSGNMVISSLESSSNRDFWIADSRPQTAREAAALFNADWNRTGTDGMV